MRNRNILTLLFTRIMSNIGDSLYFIGTLWFVKELTNNPIWIGVVGFSIMLPVVLQVFYGPIIDYFSKKKILLFAMGGQAIIFAILTIMYYVDLFNVFVIIFLVFIASLLSQLSYPTETALIPVLVPNKELTKVNSIFSFTYSTLDLICNALAGVLIVLVGVGVIFFYNSIAFTLIFGLIWLFLKIPSVKTPNTEENVRLSFAQYKSDFKLGLKCLWELKILKKMLISFTFVNLLVCLSIGILPIISKNPQQYGFWMAAMSAGMIVGTICTSFFENKNLRSLIIVLPLVSGLLWLISSLFLKSNFIISITFFGLSWITLGIINVLLQTVLQVNIPEDYLGRGFTVVSAILGSLSPLGFLLGGLFIQIIPSTFILIVSGLSLIILSIYYAIDPAFKEMVQVDKKFEKEIA